MRRSESKQLIIHHKNDIIVLKITILEFEELKKKMLTKKKRIRYHIEFMKENRARCVVCKIDIHRASYTRHFEVKSI